MDLELLVSLAVGQVGEEKVKEVMGIITGLAKNVSLDVIYIVKKLPNKGVVLLSTNDKDCVIEWRGKPKITELENIVKNIEI